MTRWIAVMVAVALFGVASEASAWGFRNRTVSVSRTVTRTFSGSAQSVCEQKAQIMAERHRKGHLGGGYGTGNAEGVCFSTKSAAHALNNCCFVGVRVCIGAAVVRGSDGWYAVRIYR
jgi:hypothetical protein